MAGSDDIRLPVGRGRFAIVDAVDAWVLNHKWYCISDGVHSYAARKVHRGQILLLHRKLLGVLDPTIYVDHKDGDGLNCRRGNLRLATNSENQRNVVGPRRNSSSPFLGVTYSKRDDRWSARICHEGRRVALGGFATADEANIARLKEEARLWGIQPRRAAAHEQAPLPSNANS